MHKVFCSSLYRKRPSPSLAAIRFLILIVSLPMAGCAARGIGSPSQLEIQVSESPKIAIDPDLSQTSSALHSFLVGQLAYDQEDYPLATESFMRASALADFSVPKIHSVLAELLLKQGKVKDALRETQSALQTTPDNTALRLLEAGLYEVQGRDDEALADYLKVLAADKNSLNAAYLAASMYSSQHNYAQAAAVLEEYTKRNPSEAASRYLLGAIYEQSGQYEKAAQAFRELLKRNPETLSVRFDLIRTLLENGDRSHAASEARTLLEKHAAAALLAGDMLREIIAGEQPADQLLRQFKLFAPATMDRKDLRLKLALADVQEQRFSDALRDLSIIIAMDPSYSLARYYRASIYGGAGHRREAFDDLFAIKPGQELFVKSRTFAAFLMKQEKNYAGAEKAIREALEAEPNNASVYAYLILILRDAKRYGEALKLIQASLEKEPNNERLLFNEGIIYSDMRRDQDALDTMEKVIAINPKHADALNFVAYALADKGKDLDRAEDLVNRALAISPEDGFYLDTLGWIQYQRRQYPDAVQTLKRATELSAGDVVVAEHYADALLQSNNIREAAEVYRTALEKGRDTEPAERGADVDEALPRIEGKLEQLQKKHPEIAPRKKTWARKITS